MNNQSPDTGGPLNTVPPRGGFWYSKPNAQPAVGEPGLHCVHCGTFKLYADLLPLGRNKSVRPFNSFKLGDSVGMCPYHHGKIHTPVALVTRSY